MGVTATRIDASQRFDSVNLACSREQVRSQALAEFISFAIGDDQYGVDIMAVREIKGWSNVSHLPKQADYVRGVLNLRGAMIPIIDLRCRFGEGLTEAAHTHVIIVVQLGEKQLGLLADRVLDIVSFETDKIQPVPHTGRGATSDFLSGLVTYDDTMIALIDLSSLLSLDAAHNHGASATVT